MKSTKGGGEYLLGIRAGRTPKGFTGQSSWGEKNP